MPATRTGKRSYLQAATPPPQAAAPPQPSPRNPGGRPKLDQSPESPDETGRGQGCPALGTWIELDGDTCSHGSVQRAGYEGLGVVRVLGLKSLPKKSMAANVSMLGFFVPGTQDSKQAGVRYVAWQPDTLRFRRLSKAELAEQGDGVRSRERWAAAQRVFADESPAAGSKARASPKTAASPKAASAARAAASPKTKTAVKPPVVANITVTLSAKSGAVGIDINAELTVTAIEPDSFAAERGLKQGMKLLRSGGQ